VIANIASTGCTLLEATMTVVQTGSKEDESAFLSSVEGEISFFRSIMRARPVGIHRYFHVLTIQSSIFKDTGRTIHIDSIWKKLRTCYDLDALDAIVSTSSSLHSGSYHCHRTWKLKDITPHTPTTLHPFPFALHLPPKISPDIHFLKKSFLCHTMNPSKP